MKSRAIKTATAGTGMAQPKYKLSPQAVVAAHILETHVYRLGKGLTSLLESLEMFPPIFLHPFVWQ